jgi:hypothetical protein
MDRKRSGALRAAFRIVGQRDIADGVIQDAFTQVWHEAHSFDPTVGRWGWAYSIVCNRTFKLRLARLRQRAVDDRLLLAIFDGRRDAPHLAEESALRHSWWPRSYGSKPFAFGSPGHEFATPPIAGKVRERLASCGRSCKLCASDCASRLNDTAAAIW